MRVHLACSLRDRLRGLKRLSDFDGVLILVPCCDIHTFGMGRPIDVAFITREGRVAASYRDVPPRRRLRCRGAAAVLERFADGAPWPQAGDRVAIGGFGKLEIVQEQGETIMKTCPTCHAVAFEDASVCYGCLHRFDEGGSGGCREQPPSGGSVADAPCFCGSSGTDGQRSATEPSQPPEFCIRLKPSAGADGAVTWDCAVELAS